MSKSLRLSLFGLLGSLLFTGPAAAATFVYDVPKNPPSPAEGSWRVTLETLDGLTWKQTTVANGIPNVPNFAANSVEITLWSSITPLTAVPVVAGSATTIHSPGDTDGLNPGAPDFSPDPGPWTATSLPSTAKWDHSPLGAEIPTDGSDFMSGSWKISANAAQFVTIAVQGDATSQWFLFAAPLVPEPASMSLACAGLAPLAAFLKRRRRSSSEEEETTDTV